MIAYDPISLDNRDVRQQADKALAAECITTDEHARILTAYPVAFYTPNFFIRIGLFALTVIIVLFSIGLLALMTMDSLRTYGALLIFSGLACYGVLEYIVHNRHQYHAGVDDALLWMAAGLLLSGWLLVLESTDPLTVFVLAFCITVCCNLRFADRVMTLVSYGAFLGIILNVAGHLGATGKFVAPFLVMAISAVVYFIARTLLDNEQCRHYRNSFTILRAAALLSFYLAGNYYIISELSTSLFDQPEGSAIPLGWLFWLVTVAMPFIYIYWGIQKKDVVFLWIGLALIAAAVFTIRNYYHVLPVEWAMTIGGSIMIIISYGLIRYLRTPRNGFTGEQTDDRHFIQHLQVESLIVAGTLATPASSQSGTDFQFGGGSGGGGGAGGQY